jgi:hypothetical protein
MFVERRMVGYFSPFFFFLVETDDRIFLMSLTDDIAVEDSFYLLPPQLPSIKMGRQKATSTPLQSTVH